MNRWRGGVILMSFLFSLFVASGAESHQDLQKLNFLDQKQFFQFLERERARIKQGDHDEDSQNIKFSMLQNVEKTLENIPLNKENFQLRADDDIFDVEICHVFQGSLLRALQLYAALATGKHKANLFLLSGAGTSEQITGLRPRERGVEFVTNRVYTSKLAYNTKNKIWLTFYKLNPDTYVSVNSHVLDYGKAARTAGVEKNGKPYGPIHYDVTIDIYKKMGDSVFQFISFNIYEGQAQTTRFKSVNAAKAIGNILTFGTLDRGVSVLVEKSARDIWESRKDHFQRLILEN